VQPLCKALSIARIVAVIRAQNAQQALERVHQVRAAGIEAVEITLTFPGALEVIRQVEGLVGCGTVVRGEQAAAAIQAGAKFVVSPFVQPEVIRVARDHGVLVASGAWTATEIYTADCLGADVVKLFPAQVGGPAYLQTLRQIFPSVLFFPCGGVTLVTARAYLDAGAWAVGIGQDLVATPDLALAVKRLRE
jgi:2-dehydro-3-deoxyphosphogluconate aldolase / (4S)-4-hydroxy-2-oxoglutarate aldolase